MHVVHLETGRRLYGGARQALLLAAELKARGVQTTFVCTEGSLVAAEAARLQLPLRALPMKGDPDVLFQRRLRKLLAELKPDLVHVHSRRGADWFGGIAARRAGVPAVLTRRVDRPEGFLQGLKYRLFPRVVAISDIVRAQLAQVGVPAARLSVIRSAVDPAQVVPTWPRERLLAEFKLEFHHQLVGCVAQLISRKGHQLLIEAWAEVARACPDARLLLFGRGPLANKVRDDIFAAELQRSVLMPGFRPDLRAFLGRLDLLVHPAIAEGLGLAVMEAQAAGVPVVAFEAGGLPEIVAAGRSGRLVPAADASALAAAVIELLQHPDQRQSLGEAARQWAAAEFGVARMVEAYLTLYGQLADTRAP
jgi:glycosyltransferase involved in cell wall biosynthesis